MSRTAFLLFSLDYSPVEKLALFNIEKDPDDLYTGWELQYINGDRYGTGYRVLAYRKDGYVDVYDESTIKVVSKEELSVAGKGLADYHKVRMENVRFVHRDQGIWLQVEYKDKLGRAVKIKMQENTARNTKPMDLLAPIGVSTENPTYFPLFLLYNFDFVRKRRTKVEISVDGVRKTPDPFPVPMPKDGQLRYYSRFSDDCQIINFAGNAEGPLTQVSLGKNSIAKVGNVEYRFRDKGYHRAGLREIRLVGTAHPLFVRFTPALPDVRMLQDFDQGDGEILIEADRNMGTIGGRYEFSVHGGQVNFLMDMHKGWTPIPNSILTKLLFKRTSVFCSWSKSYRYEQQITLRTLNSVSKWKRTS